MSSLRLGSIGAQLGEAINEFSSDVLLSQNSNEKVPTQAAVRAFVAAQISTKADLVQGRVPVEQLPFESVVFRGTFGSASSTTEGDLPSRTSENTLNVINDGSGAYIINGESNPTLTVIRGETYIFNIDASGHPFNIQTVPAPYDSGNLYTDGITNAGEDDGVIT